MLQTQEQIDEEHRINWEKANAPQRTAADERGDVLAFIASEVTKQRDAIRRLLNKGSIEAAGRCDTRAAALQTLQAYITRGDHEGAFGR